MSQPKQIKRNKSLEKINDINYYCFPFYLDKNNDNVCIFKKHQQDENMKTKIHEMFIDIPNVLFMNVCRISRRRW